MTRPSIRDITALLIVVATVALVWAAGWYGFYR